MNTERKIEIARNYVDIFSDNLRINKLEYFLTNGEFNEFDEDICLRLIYSKLFLHRYGELIDKGDCWQTVIKAHESKSGVEETYSWSKEIEK